MRTSIEVCTSEERWKDISSKDPSEAIPAFNFLLKTDGNTALGVLGDTA
jgi:hypothetical protein